MPKKIKKAFIIITVIAFAVFIFTPFVADNTAYATESAPRDWDKLTSSGGDLRDSATIASYAVLMDAHTGKVLYEEHANHRRFPASITKIMTCLVVLENTSLQNMVTISSVKLEDKKASRIGLKSGEVISVEDLLYGLMLESGNDAGVALAMYVAGSVPAFADMMNEKAAELGMTNSHFVNPHGLHDSNHYTTAMDMAKLAYAAMKNPTFRKIVGTYKYTPPTTNKHTTEKPWYPTTWKNGNRLIATSDDAFAFNDPNGHAIGIKTGYTGAAESTLVSAAISFDGTQEVIAVVLFDTQIGKWTDCITMFMYAFDFYDTIDVGEFLTEDLTMKTHVENAADNEEYDNLEMYVIPDGKAYITDTIAKIDSIKSSPERFTKEENYTHSLVAPIAKGDEIGTVNFYFDGNTEPILTCTLIAAEEVAATPVATQGESLTVKPEATPTPAPEGEPGTVGYVGYALAGAGGFALAILLIVMVRRKAKYHQYHVSARGKHSSKRD